MLRAEELFAWMALARAPELDVPCLALALDSLGGLDGLVNASDVSLTKSQVGQTVGSANFREDTNANGAINGSDVALVKANAGVALPP